MQAPGYQPPPPAYPPPAAPPADVILRAAYDCNTQIPYVPKRQRCLACVSGGRPFHTQGMNGTGYCEAPPPPPVPVVDVVLRAPYDCNTQIPYLPKRERCLACVSSGRPFHTQGTGAGYCEASPPPPPPPMHGKPEVMASPNDCMTYVASPPKRQSCLECVNRGGQFYRKGWACSVAPAGPFIDTIAGCQATYAHPGTRHHCVKCIRHGGRYNSQGFCQR
jgi:hypothetical protein